MIWEDGRQRGLSEAAEKAKGSLSDIEKIAVERSRRLADPKV